jgi:chorismate mutase
MVRGVRGAIQVVANEREMILSGAEKLLRALIEANNIRAENVAAVFFTVTPDLNETFPAEVRKMLGWSLVPFLCGQEIPVPHSLPRVIRALILFETEQKPEQIRHQYLGATSILRPDLENE